MERNSAAARHSWARQLAWLLLNFLPFPVGQTIYAHCTPRFCAVRWCQFVGNSHLFSIKFRKDSLNLKAPSIRQITTSTQREIGKEFPEVIFRFGSGCAPSLRFCPSCASRSLLLHSLRALSVAAPPFAPPPRRKWIRYQLVCARVCTIHTSISVLLCEGTIWNGSPTLSNYLNGQNAVVSFVKKTTSCLAKSAFSDTQKLQTQQNQNYSAPCG